MRHRSVRQLWLRSSRMWRCATWRYMLRTLRVSTDEGMSISGAMGSWVANSLNRTLRLTETIESLC